MGTRKTRDLPARLEGLRQRFERWRRTRKARSRIPEALWAAAVKMAGTFGLHRTARALRLDYYALKKRVERQPCHCLQSAGKSRGYVPRVGPCPHPPALANARWSWRTPAGRRCGSI